MATFMRAPLAGRYLCFEEREEIALLRAQGAGIRAIARRLGRSPSTISRELRRNAATRAGKLDHRASVAQWKAELMARRPKAAKLAVNGEQREYVQERLSGEVRRPDGAAGGPEAPPWKGRSKPRRQDRRWARAWSPEQIVQYGEVTESPVLRRPVEFGQYTSIGYTQTLSDHRVLPSVGDAYDNALAESFVDSCKTELIADRVWRLRSQLELATVEWIGWFNHGRLHESLGDLPPVGVRGPPLRARGPVCGRPIRRGAVAKGRRRAPSRSDPAGRAAGARNGSNPARPLDKPPPTPPAARPPGSPRSPPALTGLRRAMNPYETHKTRSP